MLSLIPVTTLLANGLFIAEVFAVNPRNSSGSKRAERFYPSQGPALERAASLGLTLGWGLQLFSLARRAPCHPGRCEAARATVAVALIGGSVRLAISSQNALGPAWRTSVTGTGAAPLSTAGPYRLVRHPVYAAMIGVLAANALVTCDRLATAGAVLAAAALEVQVRGVEEPALRSAYEEVYRRYAAVTGRFVPLLGRVQSSGQPRRRATTTHSRSARLQRLGILHGGRG